MEMIVTINVNYRAFLKAMDVKRDHDCVSDCLAICKKTAAEHQAQGHHEESRLWQEAIEFLEAMEKYPGAKFIARGTSDTDYYKEGDTRNKIDIHLPEKLHVELPDNLIPDIPEELEKELDEDYEEELEKAERQSKKSPEPAKHKLPPIDDDLPF